eukprot:GHUV01012282.1.p1 GENE.GHUV01012282.1~~GHUV01012282.1.p1  ORF type:complete len:518 (+),score=113.09 GHUV01012282.1:1083-2636(+)
MTYEAGGDLHEYATRYKLDETVVRYFFRQIVEGLDYCHRCHIAHRDLKLANFLLTTDQPMRVKLTDFGCARKWETKEVPQKRVGRFRTFAGTPAYMSPQVLQSAFYPTNTYDAVEADVWALGIVLCHLFFGAHTPYWLTPNAFRNEGMTMQARIQAMKEQNWVDSDEFVKANIKVISPELRDLLDKIFVADEFKRITMKGIKDHPWFNKELPPFLQNALDEMAVEQEVRDSLQRAAVSLAANRHDTAEPTTGDFATIDLLVDLAQKHGRMPGPEKVFCLDMAHMDFGALSISTVTTPIGSPRVSPPHSPKSAAAFGTADISVRSERRYSAFGEGSRHSARGGTAAAFPTSIDGTDPEEGTQHSALSYASSLQRAASAGERSTHLTSIIGAPDIPTTGKLKKTLSLRKQDNGLLVGKYVIEVNDANSGAGDFVRSNSAGLRLTQAATSLLSNIGIGGAAAHARSVHAGRAFFAEAAAAGGSVHGKRMALTSLHENKTVHGGTAHAASKQQKTGIFYQG